MAKPASLAAHRNEKRRRRAKQVRNDIRAIANGLPKSLSSPVSGYVVVTWTDDGEGRAWWDGGGSSLGATNVEDHANTILRRQISMADAHRVVFGEDGDDDAG